VERIRSTLLGLGLTLALATPVISVWIAENAVHIWQRPVPRVSAAELTASETDSRWESVQVSASDGVRLDGWLMTPNVANRCAVLLLHGVGDTRLGMLGHARYLLQAGFTVLLPDARGHGASGGAIISYGLREADDVKRWVDLLVRRDPGVRVYGLGESMGAAILIQSLPEEHRFRAIVAECPFSTFEDVASYRLQRASGLPVALVWPVMQMGMQYVRLRYGFDLRHASPLAAIRAASVPTLLIHGTKDINIPPVESERIHAARPDLTRLWEVPGAVHVSAIAADPDRYRRTVIQWFRTH